MTFAYFGPPPRKQEGFVVIAGRHNGLHDLMVIGGRVRKGDVSPVHRHEGDEMIRVVRGSLNVRSGDETKVCKADDVAVIGPGVAHGYEARADTELEVVTGYRIGTFYPVIGEDGEEWREVFRRDQPWGRPPADGVSWTTDAELHALLSRHSRPA